MINERRNILISFALCNTVNHFRVRTIKLDTRCIMYDMSILNVKSSCKKSIFIFPRPELSSSLYDVKLKSPWCNEYVENFHDSINTFNDWNRVRLLFFFVMAALA